MLERELKFYAPPAHRAALEAELRQAGASAISLRARYFDTQDKLLARAGVALRLRLEGRQWMQTIKAPGPDELTRVELNHPRPDAALDLSVYHGTALEPLLSKLGQPLLLRYETDIERLVLRQDSPEGAIELAYDQGLIRSGGRELAVHELELEQIEGNAGHLFTLGLHWLERHHLILDFRSKAERGSLLSNIVHGGMPPGDAAGPELLYPPREAKAVGLLADMSLQQAYRLCTSEGLNQTVRNALSLAAAENTLAGADLQDAYTRHLRAGIRYLLACRQLYSKRVHADRSAPQDALRRQLSAGCRAGADLPALAGSVPFQACLLSILEELVAAV